MTSRFTSLVHESWVELLQEDDETLQRIGEHLREEIRAGHAYAPTGDKIFRALQMPIEDVKVLILGQDPYPTVGHAVGLAFSVDPELQVLPASLRNIYTELQSDIGCEMAKSGDLSAWVSQGVLLLNRTLTVRVGEARSHYKLGWEHITLHAIKGLAARNSNFVSILWGSDAQSVSQFLDPERVIASVHPSPLSAHRGFFGSKPFSRANAMLTRRGLEPIDWCLAHKEIS